MSNAIKVAKREANFENVGYETKMQFEILQLQSTIKALHGQLCFSRIPDIAMTEDAWKSVSRDLSACSKTAQRIAERIKKIEKLQQRVDIARDRLLSEFPQNG